MVGPWQPSSSTGGLGNLGGQLAACPAAPELFTPPSSLGTAPEPGSVWG